MVTMVTYSLLVSCFYTYIFQYRGSFFSNTCYDYIGGPITIFDINFISDITLFIETETSNIRPRTIFILQKIILDIPFIVNIDL